MPYLLPLFLYSFLARLSRWLSIWQQKEYRLDRFRAFLLSPDGRAELVTFVNFPLSLTDFKRPRLTPKILLIIATTFFLLLASPITQIIYLGAIYLLLPAYILIATIPAWLVTDFFTQRSLRRAQHLFRQHQPQIIGITGSYGKTTTKFLTAHLLSSKYQIWFSPKSYNTPLSLSQSILQSYTGQPIVIVEYAAYKRGEISYLSKYFPPSLGILTGLTHQHLATFKSFSNLQKAKSELFQALPPSSPFFYNSSDSAATNLATQFHSLLTLTPSSTTKITSVRLNSQGHLQFTYQGTKITTHLLGKHYLENLQLSVLVATHFKLSLSQIKKQLKSFTPTPEFIHSHQTSTQSTLIIDGKTSNPNGFAAALDLLSTLSAPTKLIITPGIIDLGSQTQSIHHRLALQAKPIVDFFIHTSPTAHSTLKKSLGPKYLPITNLSTLKHLLSRLPSPYLLLIEGKIPPHLQQYLLSQ